MAFRMEPAARASSAVTIVDAFDALEDPIRSLGKVRTRRPVLHHRIRRQPRPPRRSVLGPGRRGRDLGRSQSRFSLIDGIAPESSQPTRRVVPHADVAAIAAAIAALNPASTGGTLIVVESVYSMDGDLAPLDELAEVCEAGGAALIVDEAHATGLYGPTGGGRVQGSLRNRVFATIHPCGKALGLAGAFVVGSVALRELQINRARPFIYSTAPPPFLAAGLLAAMNRIRTDPALRQRPHTLAHRLRARLPARLMTEPNGSPIIPLHVGTVERACALATDLQAKGWDARAIRPPTVPPGTCRVRLVVHANLDEAQIDQLAHDIEALT